MLKSRENIQEKCRKYQRDKVKKKNYNTNTSFIFNVSSLLIEFNQLDHIHFDLKKFSTFYITSFINYTSDHHFLLIRISKDNNGFNESHLHEMSFHVDKEIRIPME